MEYRALYFLSYAAIATIGGLVATWGMYNRQKNEGIPMNFNVLKFIYGIAAAMWAGVAFANVAYNLTPTNAAILAFVLGTVFSIFFVKQINLLIQKMNADAKTIKVLSTSCSLTELWNRRIFQERFSKQFANTRIHKGEFSLLLLDIESLGKVNSTLGYEAGDNALIELSKFITDTARDVDVVCRYSSNLITLILPDMALSAAKHFATQLKDGIAVKPFDIGTLSPVSMTVSIGVTGYVATLPTDASMVDAAHDALRCAREMGTNQMHASPSS